MLRVGEGRAFRPEALQGGNRARSQACHNYREWMSGVVYLRVAQIVLLYRTTSLIFLEFQHVTFNEFKE